MPHIRYHCTIPSQKVKYSLIQCVSLSGYTHTHTRAHAHTHTRVPGVQGAGIASQVLLSVGRVYWGPAHQVPIYFKCYLSLSPSLSASLSLCLSHTHTRTHAHTHTHTHTRTHTHTHTHTHTFTHTHTHTHTHTSNHHYHHHYQQLNHLHVLPHRADRGALLAAPWARA